MIQDNILYQDLLSDIKDRLQHQVGRMVISEEERQLLLAPERLAVAATEALLRLAVNAEASAVPDLVTSYTPTAARTFRDVAVYAFPEQTFSERPDNGILTLVIGGEELPWDENSSLESVIFRANNAIYGTCEPCFNYDDIKKRLYVPCEVSVSMEIVNIPHNIRSATKNGNVGALMTVTAGASTAGVITVSDGTNDLTVTMAGTETAAQVASAVIAAINASTAFYFDAYETTETDEIQVNIRVDAPLNSNVELTFTDTGSTSVTSTIAATGTYILPVGTSYQDELAELFLRQLLSIDLGGAVKVPKEEQPQMQQQ